MANNSYVVADVIPYQPSAIYAHLIVIHEVLESAVALLHVAWLLLVAVLTSAHVTKLPKKVIHEVITRTKYIVGSNVNIHPVRSKAVL